MKRIILNFLIVSVLLTLACVVSPASEAPTSIPVASYANRPSVNETVGGRAHAILSAKGRQSLAAGSAGMTVFVPSERAREALELSQKAIKEEGLELTLLVPKGDRYVAATPESVLEPTKQK